jgi:hypothetical protein
MPKISSAILVASVCLCVSASKLEADIVVGAPGDPGVGDCIPFGCSDASTFQQVYSSSLFPNPITIAGLTFFLNNFDNTDPLTGAPIVPDTIYPQDYTISLSVVSVPVDSLDTDLDNNLNPNTTALFFQGFLDNPVNGSFTIQTTPPNYFYYDPSQGNLLLDIRIDGSDPTITMFADINSASGGLFSSAFDSDPHPDGCPDGSAGLTTGCANADYGLVTGFVTPAATATPEPTAYLPITLIGFGLILRRRVREAAR